METIFSFIWFSSTFCSLLHHFSFFLSNSSQTHLNFSWFIAPIDIITSLDAHFFGQYYPNLNSICIISSTLSYGPITKSNMLFQPLPRINTLPSLYCSCFLYFHYKGYYNNLCSCLTWFLVPYLEFSQHSLPFSWINNSHSPLEYFC